MNVQDILEPAVAKTSGEHSRGCRQSRDQTWNMFKDEIYQVYMIEKKTLLSTMQIFEKQHGIKAW